MLTLAIAACGGPSAPGITTVTVWAHAGQEGERATLRRQVARFNAAHRDFRVRLTEIPQGNYNAQVQAAAVAGDLPDLLELDGPYLYAYVWQGRLRPVDNLLPKSRLSDLLPSIVAQGRYHGRLWAVGTYDSGLALYADRAKLRAAGVRIPTLADPWSVQEFSEVLERLAQRDPDGEVLDLRLDNAGEWYTYAMLPLIRSAGGGLISRSPNAHAVGVINGARTVAALRVVQGWIRRGRVDPDIDGAAFVSGRVALALGGHWNYRAYHKHYGDDLLLLPLPDFGHGPKTDRGSWCWAVTAASAHPRAAARFLAFLLKPRQVLEMTDANDAVPATYSAIARSPRYRAGGPLNLFVRQLDGGYAVGRPRTPAYPVITAEFQRAFDRIRSGASVRKSLDGAAYAIDQEIADNHGYPVVGHLARELAR